MALCMPGCKVKCQPRPLTVIHGHRTLKAPHPVRSAQLTRVPPSQYHGGGPRGNPGCCGSPPFFSAAPPLALLGLPAADLGSKNRPESLCRLIWEEPGSPPGLRAYGELGNQRSLSAQTPTGSLRQTVPPAVWTWLRKKKRKRDIVDTTFHASVA